MRNYYRCRSAGLTAAYELITKTDIKPIIIEKTNHIGGISRTVVHNGNRMDIEVTGSFQNRTRS
jgi:protoporphyrinogen oxidase